MGLLQEIEGLFGFGKKTNQTTQNAAAVSAAISAGEAGVTAAQNIVNTLSPFASENPIFAIAIGAAKIFLADIQVVLGWLQSLVPTAAPPGVSTNVEATPTPTPTPK